MTEEHNFCRKYDLVKARKIGSPKEPASHQYEALKKLSNWYQTRPKTGAGGILVLPTGGGKTFTAVRFICNTALSDGYKVLWLAHTHHLLEQAFYGFAEDVGQINEPKSSLKIRVVSGTKDHFPVRSIEPDDDVIIATLQTISKAHREHHESLETFLKSTGGKLFVVFDEAHHAPAPSYRKLIQNLRDCCTDMCLLGLTATPTYTDKSREGWFPKLFPQEIIYQVSPQKLMSQGILAEPRPEQYETSFVPDFDEREYQKWIGTFRDIPEDIITQMAENRSRNEYIAATYANNYEKYGKTIIFSDRWFQCEAISKFLEKRGIRAGSIYSHVVKGGSKKTADENNKHVLSDFKSGKLDVILNVKMLTEGTDVPDAETVFITRQTTSQNLLTQMVGRALRGPKFGGTDVANMVFFTDNWEHLINWAEYEFSGRGVDGPEPEYAKRPPLQYISIELVRKLAMQMDSGLNVNTTPFLTLLPAGWYSVNYVAQLNGSDNLEPIRRLVMVFDHEIEGYKNLIRDLSHQDIEKFEDESIQFEDMTNPIKTWKNNFFSDIQNHFGSDLDQDIFGICRHMAQNNSPPTFFEFEERENHDLDSIAKDHVDRDLGPREQNQELQAEYDRKDRYWKVIYPSYNHFKSQYDGCVNRILNPPDGPIVWGPGDQNPNDSEISPELKRRVKNRDKYTCLCCGTANKSRLQVDHIEPKYYGGSDDPENLQTLCNVCNGQKGTEYINFRDLKTSLTTLPSALPTFEMPGGSFVNDSERWKRFLQQTVNFFYQCGAVHEIIIHEVGYYFYHWQIRLNSGNDPKWLEPHISDLLKRIRKAKEYTRYGGPNQIVVLTQDVSAEAKDDRNFIGSGASNKYHYPDCGWAKRIPSEERIWFPSSESARNRGYVPCGVCNPPK